MNSVLSLPKSLDKILKIFSQESLYGDVFLEHVVTFRMVLEPDRVDEINWGEERGSALRIVTPEFKNLLAFCNDWDDQNLTQLAKELVKGGASFTSLRKNHNSVKGIQELPKRFLEERINFVKVLQKKIKNLEEIKHHKIVFTEIKKTILVITTEDTHFKEERNYCRVGVLVVAEKDGRLERGYEVTGKALPFEKVKDLEELLSISERASDLAVMMLSARRVPAGVMPVVISGQAGGTMIHEAVGHGLEADHAEEGLSVYSGKIGERVASSLITVIDDPTIEGLYGYYLVDDEGVPAQRTILIENGVLKDFLYDRFTALKFGKKSNGHGRRESYRCIPIPRMSNTFIQKGFHKSEEILKSIDKGILVKKMGGGEVNPLTGDFVFEVREGYYIEKGEIAYPVKGATLVGNGPKVLEIIDMVGEDLSFEQGTCGKDGQSVPVSDGQPTLRIPELTVGGLV